MGFLYIHNRLRKASKYIHRLTGAKRDRGNNRTEHNPEQGEYHDETKKEIETVNRPNKNRTAEHSTSVRRERETGNEFAR